MNNPKSEDIKTENEYLNDPWDEYVEKIGKGSFSKAGQSPDFFVISPPKTGSTWLNSNLSLHPEIFTPRAKELKYFSHFWQNYNIDVYSDFFEAGLEKVKGDVSPSYSILPDKAIATIRNYFPDLKLILLMREPTDRAWSQAKHNCRYGEANFEGFKGDVADIPHASFLENFNHLWSLAYGDYLGILERWLVHFPAKNFFLGFFEEIEKNPKNLLSDIFKFLGVKNDLDWEEFRVEEKIFEGLSRDFPPSLKGYLEHIYKDRNIALESFLQKHFGLALPEYWGGFTKDPVLNVLESGFEGRDIVLYEGNFYSIEEGYSPEAIKEKISEIEKNDSILKADSYPEIKQLTHALSTEHGLAPEINEVAETRLVLNYKRQKNNLEKFQRGFGSQELKEVLGLDQYSREIKIMEKVVKNYNIIFLNKKVYAIAQALGEFDLLKASPQKLDKLTSEKMLVEGVSLEEVREKIFNLPLEVVSKFSHMRYIEECVEGFNIFEFGPRFYAINQTLGSVDLSLLSQEKLDSLLESFDIFVGESIAEVKRIVSLVFQLTNHSEALKESISEAEKGDGENLNRWTKYHFFPRIVEEGLDGFNIVRFKGLFYVVAQGDDAFDFENLDGEKIVDYQIKNQVLVGQTLKQAKEIIKIVSSDSLKYSFTGTPTIVEEGDQGFNIVHYKSVFYVIAQGLEKFDFEKLDGKKILDYQEKNQVFVAQTLKQAKEIIKIVSSDSLKYNFAGTPTIVEEGHQGFNILHYKSVFYVIAQGVSIDVEKLTSILIVDFQSKFQLAVANSLEQAKELTGFLLSRKSQVETDEMRRNRVNEKWKQENEILKNKAQDLENKIVEYEKSQEDLKVIWAEKEQLLEDFEAKLELQSRQIQELEQVLKTKESETLGLIASGQNKDKEIDSANKELARLAQKIDEYKKQVNWDVERIEGLVKMVCAKNEEIIRLNEAIR